LHEIIYEEFIALGETDSVNVRYFNSLVFSDELSHSTQGDYAADFDAMGLPVEVPGFYVSAPIDAAGRVVTRISPAAQIPKIPYEFGLAGGLNLIGLEITPPVAVGGVTEADSYCEDLTLEGKSDWRLPGFRELFSLGGLGLMERAPFGINVEFAARESKEDAVSCSTAQAWVVSHCGALFESIPVDQPDFCEEQSWKLCSHENSDIMPDLKGKLAIFEVSRSQHGRADHDVPLEAFCVRGRN
jgi:hypothetical protein